MPTVLDPEALSAEVERARELFQVGRPARAAQQFRRLERRLREAAVDHPELLEVHVRLLLGLAASEFEVTGDLASSLRHLDEAAETARTAGASHLDVPIAGQRGLLLLRMGDNRAALRVLDGAGEALPAATPYDRMTLLLNRGTLHLDHGDLSAALADLEACAELAEQHQETTVGWKARHNLGWAEFLAGRIPRAIATLEAAEALNPGDPHPVGMLDRARVLREAGLVAEADAALAAAAKVQRAAGLWQDLGETELARAECALVSDALAEARALARSARRRFVRRGNQRWARRADVLLLRCERLALDERSGTVRRTGLRRLAHAADDLAEQCDREGRRDLARVCRLVGEECRLRVGSAPAAEAGPLPPVRARDPLATRLLTREVRALAADARHEPRTALAEVRRGLAELGSYQHSFGSLDLRTASAVHGSALARLGLDLALRHGTPSDVLAVVERSRAVSTRLPQVRPPQDERTAELMARLRQIEEEARMLAGDPAAQDRRRVLLRESGELQRAVRVRAWEVEGEQGDVDVSPRARRLARAADEEGAVFVSFARHAGTWIAVVVAGSRVRLHRLAGVAPVRGLVTRVRADLDALASPALPERMREAVRASLASDLARLEELLLEPLGVTGRRLALSCSGDLLFLPWGLLPGRAGLATTVAPSAAAWLRRRPRPRQPVVTAVAGPDLRLAAREVEEVAARWPGARTLVGPAATAAATRESLAGSDLVHVSAHGRHRADSPLFSSVRLDDGPLFAHEVDPGGGLAGCVVLSACDAGLATTRPGEEILGLAQVLLHLGSRAVVAAVARVNDEVSAAFMADLHARLSAGIDVSSAVAEAHRGTVGMLSPAAFVSYGASW